MNCYTDKSAKKHSQTNGNATNQYDTCNITYIL